MTTVKDVAKKADVSPSTVSRVINDHPRISQETKNKVLKTMDEIGYYPNITARNLVNQRTDTLGLVIPHSTEEAFADPFFAQIMRGIGSLAQKKGYSLLLLTHNGEEEEELNVALKAAKGQQIDGLLLLRAKENDKLMKELNKIEFPFVIVGKPKEEENCYWVNNDNIQASKKIVDYLIDLGHRRIGVLNGDQKYIVNQDRLEGYKLALKDEGIKYNPDYLIKFADGDEDSVYNATKKLIKSNPELTALYGVSDGLAHGSFQAITDLGFKIPNDISVVGFNNNHLSKAANPALTTVDINIYELGREATKLLIKIINEIVIEPCHVIVDTEIIVRDSCSINK